MSDVKIKLTADGSQVRKELKLIDKELQELGGSTTPKGKTKSNTGSKPESSQGEKGKSTGENAKTERRDKVLTQLQREATLIRKELQKINKSNGQGGQSSNDSTTQPSSGSGSNSTPPAGGGSGSGDGNSNNGKLAGVLGKLATATLALKAVSSAWNYVSSGAQSSATGESLAYKTYGSTLAYTDYYDAKKDAKNLGSPYGYDYDTVMNAGNTFMSRGGFTNLDNYNEDMDAILATSKAWGLDASALANTSGYMSAIGAVDSGSQKKFADLLAESIIQAEMTGREDEQLQVLETISENLARVNTTVSEQSLVGSLGMYNALVAQNENLKGTRGSDIVTSMQDMATSGNRSLDILAGFGTEYTGLSGQLALRKLAEENPEEYWARVYEGVQTYGLGDDYFKKLLYDNTGSISQAEDIMSSLPEIAQGTYALNDTTQGKLATQERLGNYSDADVSTQETYDIEKDDTKESVGEGLNNILEPFRNWYSGLGTGGKLATDATIGAGKLALGYGGLKLGGKALTGLAGKLGLGGAGAAGAAGASGAGGAGAAGASGAAAAGGGISWAGLGLAGLTLVTAPLLTSGGSYKHLTAAGREADSNDWMDKYAQEMALSGTSIDDKWEEVQHTSGVFYGDYTKEDLENRYNARQEMMDFFNSAEGMQYFYDAIQDQFDSGGKVTEDFLSGLMSWTSDNGTTYTGSQEDVEELLRNMYGDTYDDEFKRTWNYSYRWNDDAVNKFLKNNLDEFDVDSANTNGLQYNGDSLVTDNTSALQDNTEALRQLYEANGLTYGAPYSQEYIDSVLSGANNSNNPLFPNRNPMFGLYGTSHATGNDYVPYDNYLASLHKGEMVLTASEADDYRRGNVGTDVGGGTSHAGSLDININLNGSVEGLTSENQNKIVEAVVSQLSSVGLQNLISTGFQRIQNY